MIKTSQFKTVKSHRSEAANVISLGLPCRTLYLVFRLTGKKSAHSLGLKLKQTALLLSNSTLKHTQLEMWASAQRDGRPAEYSWRPLFNATKFG